MLVFRKLEHYLESYDIRVFVTIFRAFSEVFVGNLETFVGYQKLFLRFSVAMDFLKHHFFDINIFRETNSCVANEQKLFSLYPVLKYVYLDASVSSKFVLQTMRSSFLVLECSFTGNPSVP